MINKKTPFPIQTAPKDGLSYIWVGQENLGPWLMRWDKDFKNSLVGAHAGMWVSKGNLFTWDEQGGNGPTHWGHQK